MRNPAIRNKVAEVSGRALGLAQRVAALLGAEFVFDTVEDRGARAGLVLPRAG